MLILGIITSILGVVVFIFLPDRADSRWFCLTSAEKDIIHERIQDSAMVQRNSINMKHILESLKETRLYCYILVSLLMNLINGAMSIYSTLIIKNLGNFSVSNNNHVLCNYNLICCKVLSSLLTFFIGS